MKLARSSQLILALSLLCAASAPLTALADEQYLLCRNHCENAYTLDALSCRPYVRGPSQQRCAAARERRYESCSERCDRQRPEPQQCPAENGHEARPAPEPRCR